MYVVSFHLKHRTIDLRYLSTKRTIYFTISITNIYRDSGS